MMDKTPRIVIVLPDQLKTDLKIMCILTHKSMSDFVRIAIKDKIKELKNEQNNR